MKKRDGHVSNSSSTSFVLMLSAKDDAFLKDNLDTGEYDESLAWAMLQRPKYKRVGGKHMVVYKGSEYLGCGGISSLAKALEEKIPGKYILEIEEGGSP
jgi:hypothetical protein